MAWEIQLIVFCEQLYKLLSWQYLQHYVRGRLNVQCHRIWTKTNTNSLHTNSIHSILRKIRHVIQIVVHQFVHKTSAEKNPKSKKNWSLFIPRYAQIRRISTKEKKSIPYKPYVCQKYVESILGTFLTVENKNIQYVLPLEQELITEYWVNIFRPSVCPSVPLQISVGCVYFV